MSSPKVISKEAHKLISHLLSVASSDQARPVLTAIHVDKQNDFIGSVDGWRLTFVKYKDSPLAALFPKSGTFKVTLGKIGKEYTVLIEKMENVTYPDLLALLQTTEPIIEFSLSQSLLTELIKFSDPIITFRVWDKLKTVEISHEIADFDVYSLQMPMHKSKETHWQPVKENK